METKPRHGGPRRNAGRKTEMVGRPTRAKTVSLDELTERRLKVVGGGNLSRGIRIAAEIAYDKYQRED